MGLLWTSVLLSLLCVSGALLLNTDGPVEERGAEAVEGAAQTTEGAAAAAAADEEPSLPPKLPPSPPLGFRPRFNNYVDLLRCDDCADLYESHEAYARNNEATGRELCDDMYFHGRLAEQCRPGVDLAALVAKQLLVCASLVHFCPNRFHQ